MTPGIPEYLTGSTPILPLFLNPLGFVAGLVIEICLYTGGALLIREFVVRTGKGWASTLILGVAYGIVEEGLAVHTFFMASGYPVGTLGSYGRFAGTGWVWAVGLMLFHSTFSITLPLVLLKLASPENSRKPLLGNRGFIVVGLIFIADVFVLANFYRSRPFPSVWILFPAFVFVLILIAWKIPGNFLIPGGERASRNRYYYASGLSVFSFYFVYAFVIAENHGFGVIPAVLDITVLLVFALAMLRSIARHLPRNQNERQVFALSVGLVAPLLLFAEFLELTGRDPGVTLVVIIALFMVYTLKKQVNLNTKDLENLNQFNKA